ncbi:hypothetical protein BDGGKGIB_00756 [Nodularia sphaerocarpa UHCC 0038]|nr:hypothetical protein BDGGKGIB_00756 [Nodularia sphaerocarpa UHCC 0038]
MCIFLYDFSRDMENLSPCRGEALNFPPSLVGKGARACFQSLEVGWVKRSATQRSKPNMG